MPVSMVIPM